MFFRFQTLILSIAMCEQSFVLVANATVVRDMEYAKRECSHPKGLIRTSIPYFHPTKILTIGYMGLILGNKMS